MKERLSRETLLELYELLSVPMTDFDCGELCAPLNEGIPICCDRKRTIPILFKDELRWHRGGRFWKKSGCRSRDEREIAEEIDDIYEVARCPGPGACDRNKRALVCRFFPLEPYVDSQGNILTLRFNNDEGHECPLADMGISVFRQEYLRNAEIVWENILRIYPEERELYIEQSEKYPESGKTK